MKKYLFTFTLFIQLISAQFTHFNIVKEIHTQNKGIVVSAHPLASEVGASILRQGGNAFDAAIATQFALAVVYPQAGNIGGGGFLVGYTNKGEKIALDYRETAPQSASKNMYLNDKGNADTNLSQNGHLAVGVPGSVSGMFFTHKKHGKLAMHVLIQPAIDLAEKGFAITQREATLLNETQKEFKKYNQHPIAFIKESAWKAGDLLIQKDLANTLKNIQKNGERAFYEGKNAQLLVQEMQRGNGILTLEDLKNYQTKERKALNFNYKNHEVISMPLPSSGGVLLAQMLMMSSFENLEKYQHNSPEAVQIITEAERRAYADRAEYMGDPDFIDDKTQMLISTDYLKKRWKNFSFNHATPSAEVGNIVTQPKESEQTTHLSILDKFGNAVSVTTTLNGLYGSKVVVKGAGYLLNNQMDDFSIKPGVPNMYGAVGGEANAIAPNKRMLSSMTPTIVLKNNKPMMVVGTPGGTTIPTSVFQSIVNAIDFKLNPNFIINAPKFHHQWLPEVVYVEKNFPKNTIEQLKQKNYSFETRNSIGRTEMIFSDENGNITAVADGRGDDSVAVE